jgi:hypothetical protein
MKSLCLLAAFSLPPAERPRRQCHLEWGLLRRKSDGFPDPDRWNQQLASLDRSLLFAEIRYWTMVTLGGLAVLGALIFGYRTLRDLLSD